MNEDVEVLKIKEGFTLRQGMWKRIIASLTPSLGEDGLEMKLLLFFLESYSWDVNHLQESLLFMW